MLSLKLFPHTASEEILHNYADSCTCLIHFLFTEITEVDIFFTDRNSFREIPRLNGPILHFRSNVMR